VEHFVYFGLILFTGLPFLLKMNDPALPLHNRKAKALLSMAMVAVPFLVWDVLVTAAGHWSFSPHYTLGFTIINLPVEEVLFFVVVPLASILVWETLGWLAKR
jgi:lycopene cyclase domain-containing protein